MTETAKPTSNLKLSGGKDAAWWVQELGRSRKAWKDYRDRGKEVIKRYRDERDVTMARATGSKKFNILFSNTETLAPAIFSRVPVPDIRRRWQDRDPVGRMAAEVLQRCTQYCIESYDFEGLLAQCNLDYLLPGFAVARVNYKPTIKRTPRAPAEGEKKEQAYDEELIFQETGSEYVGWDMFLMSRSRLYERVWWEAFGDDLTKDEVEAKFGADVASKVEYSRRPDVDQAEDTKEERESTARIWEVWCKRGRGRFFVAEGFDGWVSAPETDPLRLEQFFPNAKPMWSIQTNNTLKPVPEYTEYQDQALELDDLTQRIDILTSAVRRRGVYHLKFANLAGMLSSTADNQFVGIEDWAAFTEKGGLLNLALEMPLDGIINAITALDERRERVKQIIYEVTGISDIVRGASDPNETMGAQEIKTKWAGLRISMRQKKFANFARDLVRLKAEIIAERFDAKTLSLMSGVELPYQADKMRYQQMQAMAQQQAQQQAQQAQQMQQQPPTQPQENPEEAKFYSQPTWEEVIQVLRDDKLRGFKIDIETDSTMQPDADAEKAARTELVTAIGGASQQLAGAVASGLLSQDVAKELFAFAMRAFKCGSAMDEAIDSMGQQEQGGMSQQQQQKEQELQQREQQVQQAEVGAKDAQHKAEMATKDAKIASDNVAHQEEIFALKQRMDEEIKQAREEYQRGLQEVMGHAENTVRGVIKDMDTQGVVQ